MYILCIYVYSIYIIYPGHLSSHNSIPLISLISKRKLAIFPLPDTPFPNYVIPREATHIEAFDNQKATVRRKKEKERNDIGERIREVGRVRRACTKGEAPIGRLLHGGPDSL